MLKKVFLSLAIALVFAPMAFAADNLSQMNPTVKIDGYRQKPNGQLNWYGSGSGTVISANGLVLTNNHVVFDESDERPLDAFGICITFSAQNEPVCHYTARLIDRDGAMDVALLKINDKDALGNSLGSRLNYLDYHSASSPAEKDKVQVVGYPASGGATITTTQGQISGFEEKNDYRYFKTDTDFDAGSSGGTVLDEGGHFIGIPTYIYTYYENVGYFLDIREAFDWIAEAMKKTPVQNPAAEERLTADLARLDLANQAKKYTQGQYPFVEVTLSDQWEFSYIDDGQISAEGTRLSDGCCFWLSFEYSPFKIDSVYLKNVEKRYNDISSQEDYKKEEVVFAGQKAFRISYSAYGYKNVIYIIPYGYTLVYAGFSVETTDVNGNDIEAGEVEKKIQAAEGGLKGVRFTKSPLDEPVDNRLIKFASPPFEMSMADGWGVLQDTGYYSDTLVSAKKRDEAVDGGTFTIAYYRMPSYEAGLSLKERLDDQTSYTETVLFKNASIRLGGLEGFMYIYQYTDSSKYGQTRKSMNLYLNSGDYDLVFNYDDKSENFDSNFPDIQASLNTFSFDGHSTAENDIASHENASTAFVDIAAHPFETAIRQLAEKGVLKGYEDNTFRPEASVNRVEALKMILESKNKMEEESQSDEAVDFAGFHVTDPRKRLNDVRVGDWFEPYVAYALFRDIVEGYSDRFFRPTQNVNLAEALKMIFLAYGVPVWSGETTPWHKKYMDKAYELEVLPAGLTDPVHPLTRAELAQLVYALYNNAVWYY